MNKYNRKVIIRFYDILVDLNFIIFNILYLNTITMFMN